MAAPGGGHVGARSRREAAEAAEGEEGERGDEGEGEEQREGEGEDEGEEEDEEEEEAEADRALRSVFPRDHELFAEAFPVLRRYRLCGHRLRIAEHHGPRLGMAAAVWETALSLCRLLGELRFDFRGRTVIELGAGTGIVGILAALLGGDVTITDRPAALPQIRENVALNFPAGGPRPRVRALEWGRDEGSFPRGFGVVLGSDIVYDPSSFEPLLRTLRHLCGPGGLVLLGAPLRGGGSRGEGPAGARRFFGQLLPPDFHLRLLRREPERRIEIYAAARKGGATPEALLAAGGAAVPAWQGAGGD